MWIEYRYEDGSTWQGCPDDETHELTIWAHEKEGFSWRVITGDEQDNAPEGWSATRDDAERHAEASYEKWLSDKVDVAMGRKPIPWEEIDDEHDEEATALLLAELEVSLQALKEENAMLRDAVAQERAAVVAWLRRGWDESRRYAADDIERGEHRREEER